jgi:hypothetical protein
VRPALGTWLLTIGTAAVLCAAVDTGLIGRVADGRQMIFTAVALAETGSLGQARSRDLTVPRPAGDSVSRYGLGMSLAHLPAAMLAPIVEASRGPGSAQWLFLIAPFILVIACARLAARIARDLGGGAGAERTALLLATIASPFGVYAAMELSEPLQAFALTGAFAFAFGASTSSGFPRARTQAVLAGACAGLAVLTKSSLLAIAPLALLPLLNVPRDRAARIAGATAAGFGPIAAVWLYFEIARFGHPLAGYAGEGFTHPFVDGAWRLLVGANKGLLLYFPAALVAVAALVRAWRQDRGRAIVLAGAVLPMAGLWMLAAPWWAWHGVDGWGPRLLVPGIPLLAAAAAIEMARWRAGWRAALVAACVLINVPPLLQHPTLVVRYTWACAWPAVDAETAAAVPHFARREISGRSVIPPDQVLASTASASPFILLPWFFTAAHADPDVRATRLNAPPWLAARPEIRPAPPFSVDDASLFVHPAFAVYDAALADQIMRAQQLRQADRALELARKLETLAPDGFADALLLESYRLLKLKDAAIDWLTHLPIERRQHPAINVVLALWDRDDGKDEEAHALLRSSAPSYPGAPVQRAIDLPLSSWPADFAAMTEDPTVAVR